MNTEKLRVNLQKYHILFCILIIIFITQRIFQWRPPSLDPIHFPGSDVDDPPDIWYIYQWCVTLNNGENPYTVWKVGTSSKFISYFPLYTILGQIPMILGFSTYNEWTSAMRLIHLAAELGIGLLLYKIASERRRSTLGIFGAALWFFNNITLKVWEIQQIDSIMIFFALWALYYVERRPNLAGFLMGCSIAIKPITLFLGPFFLIKRIQGEKTAQQSFINQIKGVVTSFIFIVLVLAVISFPFLVIDYQSYLQGILSEGASEPRFHMIARYARIYFDIIKRLNLEKIIPDQTILFRAPIILGILGVYVAYLLTKFDAYLFTSFLFVVYLYLSPVAFVQYMIWSIPFVIAAIISREYSIQTKQNNLKLNLQKLKQLFTNEDRYWTILFSIILMFAGFIRCYYVIIHPSIRSILYLISDLGIGIIIYQLAREKSRPVLGIYGITFWLFNQGTLYNFSLLDNITIGLFFAVLAIYLLKIEPDWAKIILGIAIAFSPFMLLFLPLFVIGPGFRTNLLKNTTKSIKNHLKLNKSLISVVLILILPIVLFPFVKPDYHTFLNLFLLKPPYYAIIVLICFVVIYYIHRNEIDCFAYSTLAAVLAFTFTADKHLYFPFFWFLFVILFAVGGNLNQNYLCKLEATENYERIIESPEL